VRLRTRVRFPPPPSNRLTERARDVKPVGTISPGRTVVRSPLELEGRERPLQIDVVQVPAWIDARRREEALASRAKYRQTGGRRRPKTSEGLQHDCGLGGRR